MPSRSKGPEARHTPCSHCIAASTLPISRDRVSRPAAIVRLHTHCTMSCRRCQLRTVYQIVGRQHAQRAGYSATAFKIDEDHEFDQGPSSRARSRAPSHDSYRFPERGRNGGPPDPFEILALDRVRRNETSSNNVSLCLASPTAHPLVRGPSLTGARLRLAKLLHPESSHPSSSAEHFASPSKRTISCRKRARARLTSSRVRMGRRERIVIGRRAHARRGSVPAPKAARRHEWRSSGYRNSDAGRGAWGSPMDSAWAPHDFDRPTPGPARNGTCPTRDSWSWSAPS